MSQPENHRQEHQQPRHTRDELQKACRKPNDANDQNQTMPEAIRHCTGHDRDYSAKDSLDRK
jgi:hypothetical protein